MLYLSEYANAMVLAGAAPVPAEPSWRNQTVEIGNSSCVSEPFGAATKFIRVFTDRECSLKFGESPAARPDDLRIAAHSTHFFAVLPGHRVAAVAIGEEEMKGEALLKVLGDAPAAMARAKELAAAEAAANKAKAEAKAATAEATQARMVLAVKQDELDTRAAALATARQDLDTQAAKLAADREALDRRITLAKTEDKRMADFEERLTARNAGLSEREREVSNREKELAAQAESLKALEAGYANRMARLKELAGGAQ